MPVDVALTSCKQLPEPDPDAAPLLGALAAAGVTAETVPWDDDAVDWSSYALVVLRSTWNYHLDRPTFLAWVDRVAAVAPVHNPPPIIRWNTHKSYLLELADKGVATVPTAIFTAGSPIDLTDLGASRGWTDVVVKPAVSGGSHLTFAMDTRSPSDQERASQLARERDLLVQPFIDSVRDYGERSLVVIDGELTHSVRKNPRFGGEHEAVRGPMPITDAERALAERALDACPAALPLLYARVDIALDSSGAPMLMELELSEPSLFFAQGPRALERIVIGITKRLATAQPPKNA